MLKECTISIYKNDVIKFILHHGWPDFFKRIWRWAAKSFYENRSLYIFKLISKTAAEPDQNIRIAELTQDDIDGMRKIMYANRASLQGRFSREDRCFAVLEGGDILSFFWARFGEKYLPESHLKFHLRPHQVWMYNAVTVKRARGRGLYPNIIRHMTQVLGQEGIDELFVDVEETNQPSLRAVARAGCKKIARIQIKKIFSTTKYYLQIYDEITWQQLAETIDNFGNIRCIIEGEL